VDDIKHILELQQKELNQSLKYASYIQNALLPSDNTICKYLPENFILYLPLDIVSGDFYWLSKKGNRLYIAVADCTGHGVPGAFLSILGISFLNYVVDRNNSLIASSVLNSLREHIMKSLKQKGDIKEQKDGMDMGICIIDYETNKLHFSGAFNPLYIIRDSKTIIELPGDKMQIGIAAEIELPFSDQIIDLEHGDMMYLFTDGFVDQFGGTKGKKYKYKQFRNFLLSISKKSAHVQRTSLMREFDNWKGDNPQIDDVLIWGFRFSNQI
jgi:serine phosphatase RsbU (regulator of sigma subunit)